VPQEADVPAVLAAYYCKPHVKAMSDKLRELDAAATSSSIEQSEKRQMPVKDENGDEFKADEVVNELEAFVKQRRDIIFAAQKVRRPPLLLLVLAEALS